jgi:hypothetical protein
MHADHIAEVFITGYGANEKNQEVRSGSSALYTQRCRSATEYNH